ncbi:lea domain protein [Colletotrichum karsti]|uniref:Lea domain protein n=1 Tax=Colletotrichum karsti TaxID=1095194 RepID=A0A9P6LMK4_9PEZI|nr:lea domain protein [Colletotrichum karsti]KAF9878296.1 lea domain protein [Colletotrichum karsti]
MPYADISKPPAPLPQTQLDTVSDGVSLLLPLSRRGVGPGLVILVPSIEKALAIEDGVPSLPIKWAEEGYIVVAIEQKALEKDAKSTLSLATKALRDCNKCEPKDVIGLIAYEPVMWNSVASHVSSIPQVVGAVVYANISDKSSLAPSPVPVAFHFAGKSVGEIERTSTRMEYYYPGALSYKFATPFQEHFHYNTESLSHTRNLTLLKGQMKSPIFDLESIWDEHTWYEFADRSVEHTMSTMVQEPYVNHIPTLTGGVGREPLTGFYRHNFIFNNSADTELELISRTIGIDRVVDEFIFKFTHEQEIDWLENGYFQPDDTPYATVTLPIGSSNEARWVPDSHRAAKELESLFPSLVQASPGTIKMEQSLLTALTATHHLGVTRSRVMCWPDLEEHLDESTLHAHLELPNPDTPLLIVLLDTGFPHRTMIRNRYMAIDEYRQRHPASKVQVYPTQHEAEADGQKLPDIRALDTVSLTNGHWRPKTCYGDEECALLAMADFPKRSWSGCSGHTGAKTKPQLRCRQSHQPTLTAQAESDKEPWFHQEFVEFLSTMEFRVFITTRPSSDGLRGRKGHVLRVCLTRVSDVGATEAMSPTETDYAACGFSSNDICSFALQCFESLRTLQSEELASLEVGCRLDIGADKPGGRLFVNEITRWSGAHYYSHKCSPDSQDSICEGFAVAFVDWFLRPYIATKDICTGNGGWEGVGKDLGGPRL